MKRFAAILDASLNDNEGEQRGLVAFPHRVLQPDNDMVYYTYIIIRVLQPDKVVR